MDIKTTTKPPPPKYVECFYCTYSIMDKKKDPLPGKFCEICNDGPLCDFCLGEHMKDDHTEDERKKLARKKKREAAKDDG